MDERLLPTEPIRQFLHNVEAIEIGLLVGSGTIAYFSGELVPTVAAVGTIVLLTGWHGYHWVKDKFNGDKSQFPPSPDSPGSNGNSPSDSSISGSPMIFKQRPPDPAVEETLRVVRDAAEHPMYKHAPKTGYHGGYPRARKERHRDLYQGK